MLTAFSHGRVLTDKGFVTGVAVLVQDGDILALVDESDPSVASAGRVIDLGGQMLLPGFIDTQVNGGGGVLFNEQPTIEGIRAIGAAHRRYGTTGFLPTIITDELDKVEIAVRAAEQAVASVPGALGIHVEGPFLNKLRKGIHDETKMRRLDDRAIALLSSMTAGRLLTTLAPEMTNRAMIRRLTDAGVIVAAGHTDATYEIIVDALAAGVRGFTHLFNAMSPMVHRAPGVVGAALDDTESWCGIVVDGHHVAPAVLRIALKSRGPDKLMLVTDAMPTVGMLDKSFILQGRKITVPDGVCRDERGVIAGADLDMAAAVRNSVAMLGVDLPTAVAMASRVPAEFLGLGDRLGRIAPGYQADLLQATDSLDIVQSWIKGV